VIPLLFAVGDEGTGLTDIEVILEVNAQPFVLVVTE